MIMEFQVRDYGRVGKISGLLTSPIFSIVHDNSSNPENLVLGQFTTDAQAPTVKHIKARGTVLVPTNVAQNDRVSDYQGFAYSGGTLFNNANMRTYVDAPIVSGQAPAMRFEWETGPANGVPVAVGALFSTGTWAYGQALVSAGQTFAVGVAHFAAEGGNLDVYFQAAGGLSALHFRRSNGTIAAKTNVADNDVVMQLDGQTLSGGTIFATGGIQISVDGAVVNGQAPPTRIEFLTNSVNSVNVECGAAWNTGKWSFGADLCSGGVAVNLAIFHTGANGNNLALVQRSSTDASSSIIAPYKTRGTILSPIKVEINDSLGVFGFRAHDGTNANQATAQIEAKVDAATVNGQRPATRMEFYTTLNNAAATLKATIDSAGRFGIGFVPVTAAAKLGILQLAESSLSGIYLGNTANAASNVLDWYEEGTYTPVVTFGGASTGITFSNLTGRYTRIGNRVRVWIFFIMSNKGSSTGVFEITIPFNYANSAAGGFAQSAFTFGAGLTGAIFLRGGLSANTVKAAQSGVGGYTDITDTVFNNTSQMALSIEFEA